MDGPRLCEGNPTDDVYTPGRRRAGLIKKEHGGLNKQVFQ
jgi:hypothetical protein